jgi:hypothetical protein
MSDRPMSLADQYRTAFRTTPQLSTVADWLYLLHKIDPEASMSKRDLGIYIEFSDGSVWRLGGEDRNAACMLA